MDTAFNDQEISHIKTLMNEGKDFDFILGVYSNLTKHQFTRIKYGYYGHHAKIEPLTKQQIKRTAKYKVMESEKPTESVASQSEPKKKYPRVVQMVIQDEEFETELREFLEGKKRDIEKQLAITQLKIIALHTGDFSDLPPSAVKDLEELQERMKKGENIDDIIKTA